MKVGHSIPNLTKKTLRNLVDIRSRKELFVACQFGNLRLLAAKDQFFSTREAKLTYFVFQGNSKHQKIHTYFPELREDVE